MNVVSYSCNYSDPVKYASLVEDLVNKSPGLSGRERRNGIKYALQVHPSVFLII